MTTCDEFTRPLAARVLRHLHKQHLDPLEIHHEDPRLDEFPVLKDYMSHARMPARTDLPCDTRMDWIERAFKNMVEFADDDRVVLDYSNFILELIAGYV